MRKYFSHIILTILFCYSFAPANSQKLKDNNWSTILGTEKFTAIRSINKVDPVILARFQYLKTISRPGGKFNSTDLGKGPRRRLYFIARSNDHWIISYEHGGRGYHSHCFLITIGSSPNLDIQATDIKVESVNYLKQLGQGVDSFIKWRGDEY
jgi:hypothetical protein